MLPRKGGRPNRLQLLWDYTRTPRFNPFSLTTRNRSVLGFNLSFLFDRSELLHEAMDQLLGWAGLGRGRQYPAACRPHLPFRAGRPGTPGSGIGADGWEAGFDSVTS